MNTDRPRLLLPNRHQHVFESTCLDAQLCPEHRARSIWTFVEGLDVSHLEARIKSRTGGVGAPAISPRLLLALWLYACLDGIGSAREIARQCQDHVAYRWLCGRVNVNYHTLSDFRGNAGEFLDGLLTQIIATLVKAGVVDGSTIFQDGTKVRACAGSSSFRREQTLERLQQEAAEHVKRVNTQASDQSACVRAQEARKRAARERAERIGAALEAMKEIKKVKERNIAAKGAAKVAQARASTTDPEARIMKGSSGARHAAYNVQFATDGNSRAIVGVQVLQNAVDNGLSEAMRSEVERRVGKSVKVHVTDAGYLSKETTEREEMAGVARIMPLPIRNGSPCTAAQPGDGPGVTQWRNRMKTEEAAALSRQRSGIAETPNGELKTHRAMDRLLVRGQKKAKAVVLLSAVVYNFVHFTSALIGKPLPPL